MLKSIKGKSYIEKALIWLLRLIEWNGRLSLMSVVAFYPAGSKIKADVGSQSKINAHRSTSIACLH